MRCLPAPAGAEFASYTLDPHPGTALMARGKGWTDEPLLRHTFFLGLREDKPAREVRREVASRP
jgi:ATP-dependent DNA ligase